MIARKSSLLLFVVLVLSLFCIVPLLQAAQVQLSWTAPTTNANGTPLQDLAGYKVYYGTASRSYGTPQDVGNKTTHTLTGLTGGQRYYVAVTAYDTLRNESAYSSEVTFIASLDSGLVAAYGFNEGSGRTVNDASGKGNHGTISGAFWSNSGRYGKALQFDGVNDWVTIKDSASLDLSTGRTLEAWVYPISTPTGWRTLIAKETSGNAVYYLYASSDKNFPLGGGRFGSRYGNLYGVKSLAANTWTHVATTYDTTTQRLFINGSQVAQRSQTGLIAGSSGSLRIGGSSVWGRFFKGRIDEIRIYNRALTAAEITADMNNAVTPASAPAQIATSLLASPDLEALQAALRASGAPSGDTPRLPKSKSSSGDTSSASETMAELLTADHVETAEVFVDHEWKRVAFNKPFVDPIVVAKTISYQGAEPATVRIRAVDATGFEVRLQSWPDADRVHMPEAMGYLVIERGRYTLAGGTTIEAATAEVSRAHSTVSLAFSHPFQVAPVVMTAVASANGADAVTGRPGRVSKSGFQFHLQQQAAPAQDESQETISYIAWELSSGTLDGLTFEVRRTVEVRRDEFYTLPLREPFADTPVFLADVQATGGGNPLNLRWERKDVDGIHVKIDDERSDEAGRERGPDVVGYIAIK